MASTPRSPQWEPTNKANLTLTLGSSPRDTIKLELGGSIMAEPLVTAYVEKLLLLESAAGAKSDINSLRLLPALIPVIPWRSIEWPETSVTLLG